MNPKQLILHVDMDAFYASVETRDNPKLKGKPLIIGSLPKERGVVATCSYEARKYGIHSAMNIKEAYRLCPNGIYQRPNMEKYRAVSEQIRKIWKSYTPTIETVALDEAYLDLSGRTIEEARRIAKEIKFRILHNLGLTCSIGLAYSKTAAKTASEEKKPDGYFEILTPEAFVNLIIDRDVRSIHSVGNKTAQKLYSLGINTVRDIQNNQNIVRNLLGKQGDLIVNLASGIDESKVTPRRPEDAKSISREVTFQEDVDNFELLKDILFLLALCVEHRAQKYHLYGNGITLKITYGDMKGITRSKQIPYCDSAITIWEEAVKLLDQVERNPVRLIGVGIHNISDKKERQLSILDLLTEEDNDYKETIAHNLKLLEDKYGLKFSENLNKIFTVGVLHRTIEYMRRHS